VTGTDIVDNSIIAKLVSKETTADWDDFVNTTDSLQANRDNIGTLGAGLSDLGGMSTGMKVEVQVVADLALVAKKLDHLVFAAESDDPVHNSIMAKLASSTGDWSTFVEGDDSLQAISGGLVTVNSDLANGTDGLGALKTLIDAIKTETALIVDDTDLIDNGTSGLAKIATDVAAIKVPTDKLAFTTANQLDVDWVNTTRKLTSAGLDLVLVDGKTLPAALQIIAAVVAGKITDAGAPTETFKGLDGTTTRVTVTVDSSGNRTTVVYA